MTDFHMRSSFAAKSSEFASLCVKLDAMSPLKILSRGYSIASKDGEIITDTDGIACGDRIEVKLSGGSLDCEVIAAKKEN